MFIPKDQILRIPEIERNGYKFTDGIGKISPEFLFEARNILNIDPKEDISAVQIRLGGYKGVLALAPELDYSIAIRPSMCKFHSEDSSLEVCSFARYKPAYLNRQIILLLHGLGVKKEVFLDLQQEMVAIAKNSLKDENLALVLIQQYNEQGIFEDLIFMIHHKILIKEDQYLQRMIFSLYNVFISDIKERARIQVPKSALLMGIIDEYAILEYEQVYIRISNGSNNQVITGQVIVTKNPCLHPGDLKVLLAVDREELSHLANVIVFPQKGPRPHPNECSGSDLDGDEYFVSWNSSLIPPVTCKSMDYNNSNEEKDSEISIDKVKDYFIRYMESENLGTIANLQLQHADLYGIHSDQALFLAKLHSAAVDYPKTGVPVSLPLDLKVKTWPDFMQKKNKPSYPSPGILGELYRSVNNNEKLKSSQIVINNKLLTPGFEKFLSQAYVLYTNYKEEIQALMRKFEACDEFELLLGKGNFGGNWNFNKNNV